MPDSDTEFLSVKIAALLPYLRRYSRALTGSQKTGDTYAAATLEALLEDRSVFELGYDHKVALFRAFHQIWSSSGSPVEVGEEGIHARAQRHLAKLTTNTREALLLYTVEEFPTSDIAKVMDLDEDEVNHLITVARREMEDSVKGRILVIEDEAIIAMDLQDIVADMGHAITGVARTERGAVDLAGKETPDLILSDIQLADGSSGIDAVNAILKSAGDIPVIFITAYPERLLTGDRPEPTYLVTKPFQEATVRAAISQALFFNSNREDANA